MILSWKPEKWVYPRRLAGTARQYSSSAIVHETRIAFQSGHAWPYFRWPYQAKVMKTFDMHRRATVLMARGPRGPARRTDRSERREGRTTPAAAPRLAVRRPR